MKWTCFPVHEALQEVTTSIYIVSVHSLTAIQFVIFLCSATLFTDLNRKTENPNTPLLTEERCLLLAYLRPRRHYMKSWGKKTSNGPALHYVTQNLYWLVT